LRLLLTAPFALDAALDAGLMLGAYRGALPANPAARTLATSLARRLSPAVRNHLNGLVKKVTVPREALSLARWSDAVDATCRRIALVVTGDLASAAAALGRDKEKLADLLLHS